MSKGFSMAFWGIFLLFSWFGSVAKGEATPAAPATEPPRASAPVIFMPVGDAVDKVLLVRFQRCYRQSRKEKPAAVVVELNTPGGGLAETKEIITLIRAIRKAGVPVYAWVNSDALSAGAIIAMSCDKIYVSPGASVGSAMPIVGDGTTELPADVHEKILSAVRGMVSALAQENGYREDIALAMVDRNHPDITYVDAAGKKFHCEKGKLLNLTGDEALFLPKDSNQPLLAAGKAATGEELLALLKLERQPVVTMKEEHLDVLARWIATLGPVLMAIGMMLLWIEFSNPGFGVPGIAGICLLALNFFGHYVAGMAGLEEILLVTAGIILIGLEIFVIPGFGLAGISGIVCLVLGALLAFMPHIPDVAPLGDMVQPGFFSMLPAAAMKLGQTILISAIGIGLIVGYFDRVPVLRGIVLSKDLGSGNGLDPESAKARQDMVGRQGTALTDLRPAGVMILDGRRVDVVSSGSYIHSGATVRVIGQNGTAIVVEECPSGEKQFTCHVKEMPHEEGK